MATSPIYSWPEPDNTDLVKNGALAIRTLGNAIDTTMATMTPKSLVDAKGDLIAATANDTPARLAVGSNGETLVADSSTSTGLRYQSNFAAGKNAVINGAFDIWQRGTSVNLTTSNPSFLADRFQNLVVFSAGTASVSRQTFTPGTAPVAGYEGQYFQRVNTGTTATYLEMNTKLENVQTFAGQTITVSFWAKASASFTLKDLIRQNFGSGGSANVDNTGGTYALTTSWQRFSRTLTLGSLSGKTIGTGSYLQMYLFQDTGALGGFNVDLWGVQIEASNTATAFQTATGTIQGELAACQRYFNGNTMAFRHTSGTVAGGAYALNNYLPPMRTLPTLAFTAAASATNNILGTPTLDVLQADTGTYSARLNYQANGASSDTFYVRAFSASAEL